MLFKYRLLKSSWGIAIDLNIEEAICPSSDESYITVTENLFLQIDDRVKLDETSTRYLINGLKELSNKIQIAQNNKLTCIHVIDVIYNPTDFQEEGLYLAIQKWAKQHYHLDFKEIEVTFDKVNNKYVLNW